VSSTADPDTAETSAEAVDPLFSIVTPVYDTPIDVLEQAIASVRAQTVTSWELILVDDCSSDPAVRHVLRAAAAADPRIRVIEREVNGHIVAASNDGVAAATADWIALLDHDDLLTPDALEHVQRVVESESDVDYIYSDEDKVDATGRRFNEFQKPSWSPERLRGGMYTCHFSVLRTSLVREVGGFRAGTDGSQDHDLVLRVTERARKVVHIPRVLYHWRIMPGSASGDSAAKPYAWRAGRAAVQAHLERSGLDATAEYGPGRGTYRIRRNLDPAVRVTVVIPTRGTDGLAWGMRRCFVVEAVRSLLERGGHDNLDIVLVHDTHTPVSVLDEVEGMVGDRLQRVPYDRPFNFSEKCNQGVIASYGEVVVLLNDDIEITGEGFVTELVAPLFESGVGMTGAHLVNSDTTVQHAGLALDRRVEHLSGRTAAVVRDPGPFLERNSLRHRVGSAMVVNREVSGVTAAALAIKRSVYERVGGMSEAFPVNFGDVDLSMKVAGLDYRILWVAGAQAVHFEAMSREPAVLGSEVAALSRRWLMPRHDAYLPEQTWGDLPRRTARAAYQSSPQVLRPNTSSSPRSVNQGA
jgi:GT2 family glycosyltransferase